MISRVLRRACTSTPAALPWLMMISIGCADPAAGPGSARRPLSSFATGYVLALGETSIVTYVRVINGSSHTGPGLTSSPAGSAPGEFTASPQGVVAIDPASGTLTGTAPGRVNIAVALDGHRDTASATVVADTARTAARATHLGVGIVHTCARFTDAIVRCWGSNHSAQLGTGRSRDFTATLSPTPIAFNAPLVQVSTGTSHSCALTSVGQAVCWGDNTFGQVQASAPRYIESPLAVAQTLRFTAIAAGGFLTCGLTTNGTAHCWGLQLNGIQRLSGPRFTALSAGLGHACALDETGTAYCWGAGQSGQLGTGTAAEAQPTRVATTERFASIATGAGHTCGVTLTAQGRCWGDGALGQLGTGTRQSSALPVEVQLTAPLAHIDAGQQHTCAVTTDGVGYCWGSNLRGQLGIGAPSQPDPRAEDFMQMSPVAVPLDGRVRAIVTGRGQVTCALAIDQRIFCWGLNGTGAVGSGRLTLDARFALEVYWEPVAVRIAP